MSSTPNTTPNSLRETIHFIGTGFSCYEGTDMLPLRPILDGHVEALQLSVDIYDQVELTIRRTKGPGPSVTTEVLKGALGIAMTSESGARVTCRRAKHWCDPERGHLFDVTCTL